jgi:signal peptidase I
MILKFDLPYEIVGALPRQRHVRRMIVTTEVSIEITSPKNGEATVAFEIKQPKSVKTAGDGRGVADTVSYAGKTWMAVGLPVPAGNNVAAHSLLVSILGNDILPMMGTKGEPIKEPDLPKETKIESSNKEKLIRQMKEWGDRVIIHDGKFYVQGEEPVYMLSGDRQGPYVEIVSSSLAKHTARDGWFRADETAAAKEAFVAAGGNLKFMPEIVVRAGVPCADLRGPQVRGAVRDMIFAAWPDHSSDSASAWIRRLGGEALANSWRRLYDNVMKMDVDELIDLAQVCIDQLESVMVRCDDDELGVAMDEAKKILTAAQQTKAYAPH